MLHRGELGGARILDARSVDEMVRVQTTGLRNLDTGEPAFYGLGWGRPGLEHGPPESESAFGHAGATGSALVVDPEHQLVIVYLRNAWGVSSDATSEAIDAVYSAVVPH